jgi:hypothetical protein
VRASDPLDRCWALMRCLLIVDGKDGPMRYGLPSALGMLVGVGLTASVVQSTTVSAQTIGQVSIGQVSADISTAPIAAAHSNKYSPRYHYFVEFRARNAASYGHVYVMYGEANARHEVIKSEIAGLGPAGDAGNCLNCSVYNWTMGHLIPVPGEIAATDGDLEEQYVLARYRIWIDAAEYKRLVAYINERKADKVQWHAMFNNCVMFGRDVAAFLNLNIPPLFDFSRGFIPYPKTAVEALRDANGGEKNQAPLKDAPGALPVEVAAKMHIKTEPPPQTAEVGTSATTSATESARPFAASSKHTANDRDEDKHASHAIR